MRIMTHLHIEVQNGIFLLVLELLTMQMVMAFNNSAQSFSHALKVIELLCFVSTLYIVGSTVFFLGLLMPNCFKEKGQLQAYRKKKGNYTKKCQTIILALHTVATMFQKPHFICHQKLIYTNFAYKKYILKIAYS